MRIPRKYILYPNYGAHMMWRAHNKEWILESHKEKNIFKNYLLKDLKQKSEQNDFKIHAVAIMSNHIHQIITLGKSITNFSNHMRRVHSNYGLNYNKRNNRIGKVAHDRPKTTCLQNDDSLLRAQLYLDLNPVRAKKTKMPWHYGTRSYSTCRFYSHGDTTNWLGLIELPNWYLALGKTPKKRQKKYRRLLINYMKEVGLLPDITLIQDPFFAGQFLWIEKQRNLLKEKLTNKINSS